jgi:Ca2+-binding RTX toxin-like protein
MRLRAIVVSVATTGLMVGPTFVHGILANVVNAGPSCTITGTAAGDTLVGTTKDDVICTKAGSDIGAGLEGNDVIRLGQGDDTGYGDDGSDVVKGQQDDDDVCGNDQNDKIYGGQGDDTMGGENMSHCSAGYENEASPGAGGNYETGNDFLKSRDNVSGNDAVDGGENTDTCRIDAGDQVILCEL